MRWLVLLTTLSVVAACGDGERAPGQWPISKEELAGESALGTGEATYRRYCIACHGADGKGNGGVTGADFTGPDSPLRSQPDDVLIASVRDGKRGERATMPPHRPVLKDHEIAAVVAYVKARFAPSEE